VVPILQQTKIRSVRPTFSTRVLIPETYTLQSYNVSIHKGCYANLWVFLLREQEQGRKDHWMECLGTGSGNYKLDTHLCQGAYWCTHNHAHMPRLLSNCIFISLIPAYVCLSMCPHFPPIPYSHKFIAAFILCFVFCSILITIFLFSFSCSINLINTYVTVPIDVRITLPICLDSILIFIFISLIPAYVYLNMYERFPPLPYSYTFIAIFMCMFCVIIYISIHLFFSFFFLYKLEFDRHLWNEA